MKNVEIALASLTVAPLEKSALSAGLVMRAAPRLFQRGFSRMQMRGDLGVPRAARRAAGNANRRLGGYLERFGYSPAATAMPRHQHANFIDGAFNLRTGDTNRMTELMPHLKNFSGF